MAEDVQRIIQCSATIAQVDVSPERFQLSEWEKETGQVLGLISPISEPLQCRHDDPSLESSYATPWVSDCLAFVCDR